MPNEFRYHEIERKIALLLAGTIEDYCQNLNPAVPLSALKEHLNTLTLDIPKEKGFGDLSSNIALRLSRLLRQNPQAIASEIAANLSAKAAGHTAPSFIRQTQAKSGFINFFLKDEVFFGLLEAVSQQGAGFAKLDLGRGERLLLEFVSANPTGPLSVAHARQAAVGDALANVLTAAGYQVTREYYLNDEGNQINILARSILARYRQLEAEPGVDFAPEYYQGQYIIDLAAELRQDYASKAKIAGLDPDAKESFFRDYGASRILAVIKQELEDFGARFDVYYSQKELAQAGKIEETLSLFKDKGFIYEAEGALWFKSSLFGDDKDRVLRKSDGAYTYLAPDIAYHADKFARGFQRLVNIWGPDHHGYISRMKAAIAALGQDPGALCVIIVQLATLFRNGQPVPMSTRQGQYVSLREVLGEVGRDAARFFFLMRKTDSHLDFDLELAKKQTSENPVYYVQYAHARISGILAAGPKGEQAGGLNLALLKEGEERDLMKAIFAFAYCLIICAKQLDPYPLTVYLQSLAAFFHKFYDKRKVLSDNPDLTRARLFLIRAVKIVLESGLKILGVSAPDKM